MADAFDDDPVLRVDAPAWFRSALAVPFEQRSITVDGCDINYLQWGEQVDAGLVFVHGGGAHAHWWTHVAATFGPRVRCVALDLSGHGDSGRRDDYTLAAWTDEVVAVAEAAGIERPVLIGHSIQDFQERSNAALAAQRTCLLHAALRRLHARRRDARARERGGRRASSHRRRERCRRRMLRLTPRRGRALERHEVDRRAPPRGCLDRRGRPPRRA